MKNQATDSKAFKKLMVEYGIVTNREGGAGNAYYTDGHEVRVETAIRKNLKNWKYFVKTPVGLFRISKKEFCGIDADGYRDSRYNVYNITRSEATVLTHIDVRADGFKLVNELKEMEE